LFMSQWSKFRSFVYQGRSYIPEDVPGDGNCFYHCMVRSGTISVADAEELRRRVCCYAMTQGRSAAKRVLDLLHVVVPGDSFLFEDIITRMSPQESIAPMWK